MASSMIIGATALLSATAANAQQAPAGSTATEVEGVVITGSRIPQPNLTSVSPIQVVGSEEFRQQGQTDTVDMLNDLPMVFQNDTAGGYSNQSNSLASQGGFSTIDLRGLGPQRTLVLVDGRRLGAGDPNTGNGNPAPDINQIPSQLIQRVDVLTGGASATYGSDAIAGVVNFIMRRDFQGVQIEAQYGINQHNNHNDFMQGRLAARGYPLPKDSIWDGESRDVSIVMGANFDEGAGNVTAYFTYHEQSPSRYDNRDFAACQFALSGGYVATCAGSTSSNSFQRAGQTQFAVSGTNFVPWGTVATTPPDFFNSNVYSYVQHPDTRYAGGFFAHREINRHFDVYSDFSFMNDRSLTRVAPSGLFIGGNNSDTGGFLVNCGNPLLSAQQRTALCSALEITNNTQVDVNIGRRNIEGGGRTADYEHTNYRAVFGSRGEIAGPWNYDVYGSYYYTNFTQANEQYLSLTRIQNALLVGGTAANPVCLSGGACVPYNIFRDGGVTQAQLAYLSATATQKGSVAQSIIEGTITGDLDTYGIRTPWAVDGVAVAFGASTRRDSLVFAPDETALSGDLSGFGGASTAIDQSIRVNEYFAEARVPLVQRQPLAHDVSLELGYRYSDYSSGITADTYKVGLNWSPVEQFRLRASYQMAIRAPTLIELFTPQSVTNTSSIGTDPCAPTIGAGNTLIPAVATLAQCQNTGVTPAQYGNGGSTNTIQQCISNQCSISLGGNPTLTAEQAKTFSVGFTFRPVDNFLDGLIMSVDYYRIELSNLVGTFPVAVAMDRCLSTGQAAYCSLIHRGPNGSITGQTLTAGYMIGTNVNVGAGRSTGIDVQGSYALPLSRFGWDNLGRLQFNLAGSYLLGSETTLFAGAPTYDCAGLYGKDCQTLNPRWRHNARVTWMAPMNLQFSLNWRYFGGTRWEDTTTEPLIGIGATPPINRSLPARSYLDVAAQWTFRDRYVIRSGINNILDQDPPLVATGGAQAIAGTGLPNTYTAYDLVGRRMFVSVSATF